MLFRSVITGDGATKSGYAGLITPTTQNKSYINFSSLVSVNDYQNAQINIAVYSNQASDVGFNILDNTSNFFIIKVN